MIYLPDTNALSAYLRGTDAGLVTRFQTEFPRLRLSVLVVAEREFGFRHGAAGPRQLQKFQQLVELIPIEPFTRADAAAYARLRAMLEKQGQPIGPMDNLIAAQTLRLDATLVTHNLREFRRVPGLKCESWQTA